MTNDVCQVDPLYDSRWAEFLEGNPQASVFHTRGWLQALKLTYGYEPVAYTTTAPGLDLSDGWVFCHVKSWLTGRRLVSLPFSDHCEPLVKSPQQREVLSQALRRDCDKNSWSYIEYRPLSPTRAMEGFATSETFCFHRLDLKPDLAQLFRGLHRASTQRKVRRAEREGLTYAEGCSETLLDHFYQLLLRTRHRHHLPPQPRKWFSNLASCMGDRLTIRLAFTHGVPVASILTLRFRKTLVYKYGCGDERFFRLGGMQMLLWRAIEEAKKNGLDEFDLGRSDWSDEGLIKFKDRLGARRTNISYFRHLPGLYDSVFPTRSHEYRKELLSYIPGALLTTGGRLLYRHFG